MDLQESPSRDDPGGGTCGITGREAADDRGGAVVTPHEGAAVKSAERIRATATERREAEASERDAAAGQRDRIAARRDDAAAARDIEAEDSEEAAYRFASASGVDGTVIEAMRAARSRRDEARKDREASARDRTAARVDRAAAKEDRQMAGRERRRAAQEQLDSSLDALTGLWRRGPGLVVLAQEAARAQRMRQPLTVAFIDVVGLKVVNDSGGHAAGDELLRAVADALRSSVRPYDAVVRYGGDEFICALPGLGVDGAGKRVRNVNETLAARGAAVTIGLAEMRPDDNIEILIARADEELYKQRE